MPIYLDNNSSTPLSKEVKEAILEELDYGICNPASTHRFGQLAKGRLDLYRRRVASFFSMDPEQITFTSSATEALNFLLHHFLELTSQGHVISSNGEHSAVFQFLKRRAKDVTFLDAIPSGVIGAKEVEEAIREKTKLICIMAANNETGIINDIEAIAELAYKRGIYLVVDGVALLGKGELPCHRGISAMAFSGHKIHAPPGVGVALLFQGAQVEPLILGGPQEYNRRAGTENIAYAAGFSKALELIHPSQAKEMARLRDLFEEGLLKQIPGLIIHGKESVRVANTSNIFFPEVEGEIFVIKLDQNGVAASMGSACSSGSIEPSRALLSMGVSPTMARSSLRFSLSRMTTEAEIEQALSQIYSGSR